jgi:Arc/MetJ-type ribon-helix-helix transcriptional regulator
MTETLPKRRGLTRPVAGLDSYAHGADMTMTITLPPELARFVKEAMSEGRFDKTDDLIASAVEMLRAHEKLVSESNDDLRREAAIGLEDLKNGDVEDWNAADIKAEGRRLIAARRRGKRGTAGKG